jgi:hypothetical protein
MDKIKKLEINRLVRELEFVESDLEYKSEIIQKADQEFIQSVNTFIEGYPDLKKIYDEKYKKFHQEKVENIINKEDEPELIEDHDTILVDPKVKGVYRNIVKQTHPDKIEDSNLNRLYIESTKHYQNGDILALYKVCDLLGINYEFEESDYDILKQRVQSLKERIQFMESTFTWAWLNTDESKKEEILFKFIKLQLG